MHPNRQLLFAAILLGGLGGWLITRPGLPRAAGVESTAPLPPSPPGPGTPARAPAPAGAGIGHVPPAGTDALVEAFGRIDDADGSDLAYLFDTYRALLDPFVAAGDFASARALVDSTPERAVRGLLLRALADIWGRTDPGAAAAWVAAQPPDAAHAQVLGDILSNWAAREPQPAARFALELPPGDARSRALARVIEQWRISDFAAAHVWLESAGREPAFDHAIAALSGDRFFVAADPLAALDWVARIHTPAVRVEALADVFRTWSEADAPAARRHLLISSRFSPADRAELMQKLDTRSSPATAD